MIRKLLNKLPNNWLYQLVSLFLITSFTYYIFKFSDKIDVVQDLWSIDEKYLITTFLLLQFLVKGLFYWVLFLVLKSFLFGRVKDKLHGYLFEQKSLDDLKTISKIRRTTTSIIRTLIDIGLLEKQDFSQKIEIEPREIEEATDSIIKWICVLIHTALTSILVFELSAFYILPIFILIFLMMFAFWYGFIIMTASLPLMEKTRLEIHSPKKVLWKEKG